MWARGQHGAGWTLTARVCFIPGTVLQVSAGVLSGSHDGGRRAKYEGCCEWNRTMEEEEAERGVLKRTGSKRRTTKRVS